MHVAILHSQFWLPLQNWYCLIICILYALILTIGFVFVRLHCKINSMYKSPNRLTLWTDGCTLYKLSSNQKPLRSNGSLLGLMFNHILPQYLQLGPEAAGGGGRGQSSSVARNTLKKQTGSSLITWRQTASYSISGLITNRNNMVGVLYSISWSFNCWFLGLVPYFVAL